MNKKILIIDDSERQRNFLTNLINKRLIGFMAEPVSNYDGAMHMVKNTKYYAAIVDMNLGSDKGTGSDIILEIAKKNPFAYIIIRSADAYKREYDLINTVAKISTTKSRVLGHLESFEIPTENLKIDCIRSYNNTSGRRRRRENEENYLGKDIIDMLKTNINDPDVLSYKDIIYVPGEENVIIGEKKEHISPAQSLVLEFFLRNVGVPLLFEDIYFAYKPEARKSYVDDYDGVDYSTIVRNFLTNGLFKIIPKNKYFYNIYAPKEDKYDRRHIGYKFGEIEY